MLTLTDVTEVSAEAERVMRICNACRYCEGFCPVFPAMAARTRFDAPALHYLANLCHNCTACYHACQYKPPHSFDLNVPQALAAQRLHTYQLYAWPRPLAAALERSGLWLTLTAALAFAAMLGVAVWMIEPAVLFAEHRGPGAFYRIISHSHMVLVGGVTFGFSLIALTLGARRFWRASGLTTRAAWRPANWQAALRAAATLEHLGGGHGEGCNTDGPAFSNRRRYYHQLTMWGFLLCFAATCAGTFNEYVLGTLSPFPFFSAPVLLGTTGGMGLLIGPAGLLWTKLTADSTPMLRRSYGMDYAFLTLLFAVSLTGLALLGLRGTSAMGVLLLVHLGFVLTFFVTLPYSKFVHAIYRFAALLRYAEESRAPT